MSKGKAIVHWYDSDEKEVASHTYDVKVSKAGSVIFTAGNERVEYRNESARGRRIYGSSYFLNGRRMPNQLTPEGCMTGERMDLPTHYWEDDSVKVKYVEVHFDDGIQTVLSVGIRKHRAEQDEKKEWQRRFDLRYGFTRDAWTEYHTMRREHSLFEFQTLDKAVESTKKLWDMKLRYERVDAEAHARWPEDLTGVCPGDAGSMGDLLIGISDINAEDENE